MGNKVPPSAPRAASWRLSFYYAAYFAHIGAFAPYWPLWLKDFGLDAELIGWTFSAGLWLRIFSNPLLAWLADRLQLPRLTMALLSVAALLVMLGIALGLGIGPAWGVPFLGIMILTTLLSIFVSAQNPIAEAHALKIIYRHRLDYGRIRLWGSFAFIGLSFTGGALIDTAGVDILPGFYMITLAVIGVAVLGLPAAADSTESPPRAAGQEEVSNRKWMIPFGIFLLAASLIQASHAALYGFASIAWTAQGLDNVTIGYLWAEGVLVEIILFALSARFVGRLGPVGMLILGGFGAIVRWIIMAASPGLELLLIAQALHGLSFGAAHIGAMHYIAMNAPARKAGFAQSLYTSVAVGLAMGGAMAFSGRVFAHSGSDVFWYMCVMAIMGTVCALILAITSQKAASNYR